MRVARLIAWITISVPTIAGAACPCMVRFGVCDETKQSDVVFVGRVESIAPRFFEPGEAMRRAPEIARLQSDGSAEGVTRLRQLYLQLFDGASAFVLARFDAARTQSELQAAFEIAQAEGRTARLRVDTVYKREGDDDSPESFEVRTGGGECGIDFQPGETYLVYADEDEASGHLETGVCTRTRRLSDEAGDLAYLYFFKYEQERSARIEGFVTGNFADLSTPRYENSISTPAAGYRLELTGAAGVRYASSATDGRFVFDGTSAGQYRLSLLAEAAGPALASRTLQVEAGACVRPMLLAPAKR